MCTWYAIGVRILATRFLPVRSRAFGVSSQAVQIIRFESLCGTCIQGRTYSTYFTKITGPELWEGVTGVSNAGKKKGRGKRIGQKKVTDLNRGQEIGVGYGNFEWPGLNAPVAKGQEVMRLRQLPPNPDRLNEVIKLRDRMSRTNRKSLPPLLRGWSGSRFPGQSIGPPDPIGDYTFEGFDTRVLEFKVVANMTGTLGRKFNFLALVVTGNKNGLAGFGFGKSPVGKVAIRLAKNRAAQRLVYIPRFEDHTGFGLRCHRVLRTIAQLIGIKDLHCNVDGNTKNYKAIAQAFFNGLLEQETHGELAQRTGYHVVEFRKECAGLPVVVGAPAPDSVAETELKDEEEDLYCDFERLYYGGRCEYIRPKKKWVYEGSESWEKKKAQLHARRNQAHSQMMRQAGLW